MVAPSTVDEDAGGRLLNTRYPRRRHYQSVPSFLKGLDGGTRRWSNNVKSRPEV